MIYIEYKVKFYKNSQTGKEPVLDYLMKLKSKDRAKIQKFLEYLKFSEGYLGEPYSRHIKGRIRELRVDFFHNRHRIFYFTFIGKNIILLHAFLKKTEKTPISEISMAINNLHDFINNQDKYDL